ncbi:hypothetical protein NDU88_002588 [Pleurodeles waltl]|uniref:Uncharacterized protein n=1 Tax=Pleurodeles waltl TaxID=8319 RepID=A0AAV7UY60_PLEWA|nr:hypothetical protein NDU88_002588 [Pleurodeles waltl]
MAGGAAQSSGVELPKRQEQVSVRCGRGVVWEHSCRAQGEGYRRGSPKSQVPLRPLSPQGFRDWCQATELRVPSSSAEIAVQWRKPPGFGAEFSSTFTPPNVSDCSIWAKICSLGVPDARASLLRCHYGSRHGHAPRTCHFIEA